MKIFNIKIYKIIIWGICFLFLSHNSACVSIATGALEGANENQLRKNRINYATKSMGFDQAEFNDYSSKMEIAFACTDRIYEDPKYYQLKFKSPEVKSYKHYSDNSYISYNERILLSDFISENQSCLDKARYKYYSSPLVVEFKMIIERALGEVLFLYSRLDNGELTWGQFNRKGDNVLKEMEYQISSWESKLYSAANRAVNIVALQEEQDAMNRYRAQIRNEFRRTRNEMQALRNEVRRVENQNRFLEMCARYPGKYMNCY